MEEISILSQVEEFSWGFQIVCLFVFLTFNQVFASHTSDLRTETDPDVLPVAKTPTKMRTSLDPQQWELAGKWRGPSASPSFPGEASEWAAPASKS